MNWESPFSPRYNGMTSWTMSPMTGGGTLRGTVLGELQPKSLFSTETEPKICFFLIGTSFFMRCRGLEFQCHWCSLGLTQEHRSAAVSGATLFWSYIELKGPGICQLSPSFMRRIQEGPNWAACPDEPGASPLFSFGTRNKCWDYILGIESILP